MEKSEISKWNKHLHLERYNSIAKMVLGTIEKYGNRICQRWWGDEECTVEKSITYNELKVIMKNVIRSGHFKTTLFI